jgi:ribosomal protein S17E
MKIEKVICITIKSFEKRINSIKKRFENYDLEFSYGTHAEELKISDEWILSRKNFGGFSNNPKKKKSAYSLYLNYINVLENIVSNKLNNVLVIEDDAFIVNNNFNDIIIPPDTDMFYLGGFFGTNKKKKFHGWNYEYLLPINIDMVIKIPNFKYNYRTKYFCAHSIFYPDWKKTKNILDFIKKYQPKAIDNILAGYVHSKFNCYCTLPSRIIQKDDNNFSHIENKKKVTPYS